MENRPIFERVLHPTDLSVHFTQTLGRLISLKSVGMTDARLLHLTGYEGGPEALSERERARLGRDLSLRVDEMVRAGVRADFEIKIGVGSEQVVASAKGFDATLIFLGPHVHGFFKDLLVGSVEDELIRHSKLPLLLEGPEGHGKVPDGGLLDRVVVPVDFTETTKAMLDELLRLAPLGLKRVALVHVVEGHGEASAKHMEKVREAEDRLGALAEETRRAGVDVYAHVHTGHPAEEILKAGAEERATLMLMCAGAGRRTLARLLGRTAERVVHGSSWPTLFFPHC